MANFPKPVNRLNNYFGLNSFNNQQEKTNSISSSNNCVFKIPKTPPRLKKCHNSVQTQSSVITDQVNNEMNNPFVKEIAERFQILQKLDFPQEKLALKSKEIVAELNALCVDKLREQIIVPTSTVSVANSISYENQRYTSNNFSTNNFTRGMTGYLQPAYNIPQFPSIEEGVVEAPIQVANNLADVNKNRLSVIPSDDENDSLTSFFRKKRNAPKSQETVTTTTTTTANTNGHIRTKRNTKKVELNKHNTEQNISRSKHCIGAETKSTVTSVRKTKTVKQPVIKNTLNSEVRECSVRIALTEPADKSGTKKISRRLSKTKQIPEVDMSSSFKKPVVKKNIKRRSTIKTLNKSKKKKTKNINSTAEKSIIPKRTGRNSNNGQGFCELPEDSAFFNDVSSIAGLSMVTSTNTMKNMTKHSINTRNNYTDKFFSPFAKTHSASVLSATSTPLSKTLAKNILSKRLKKPNIAAEIKAMKSPKKKSKIIKHDAVLLGDSENSNSDCDASDFSD